MAPPVKPKPTVHKPKPPVKPRIEKPKPPAKRLADQAPPEADAALDALEKSFFAPSTVHSRSSTSLLSPYGYFRMYEYLNQGNPNDKHIAVFFFNKKSAGCFETRGTIARTYVNGLKNRDKITDFPISDELVSPKNPQDRISQFSMFVLEWSHATNKVTRTNYKEFKPVGENTLVAYASEIPVKLVDVEFQNWRDVKVSDYAKDRTFRHAGKPAQILLHETATLGSLKIGNVGKVNNTYHIPHFCINNIDNKGIGEIIQFVDIAEKTYHGENLNDRSIGIEFVNTPFEEYEIKPDPKDGSKKTKVPKFKLESSTKGVYFKTGLGNFKHLFIPLEFSETGGEGWFSLTLRKDNVQNFEALDKLELGAAKAKVIEVKDGTATIKLCRSSKFENLIGLLQLLNNTSYVPGIDLLQESQHHSVYKKDGKAVFIFQQGYLKGKGALHYAVDIRLPGMYTHGLIGHHSDGFLQGLYAYLRLVRKLEPQAVLQKMLDVLAHSDGASKKPKASFTIEEKLTVSKGKEEVPKTPKKITISHYVPLD